MTVSGFKLQVLSTKTGPQVVHLALCRLVKPDDLHVTEVKSLAVILSNKTSFPADLVAADRMWPRIGRKI